jgi:DNA-binding MarR family transcriptional regulator
MAVVLYPAKQHLYVDTSTNLLYIQRRMKHLEQYQHSTIPMVRKMLKHFAELINQRLLLDKSPISYEQFPLLMAAIQDEGSSMQEIARKGRQHRAGILRGLRALEVRGLIKFRNDPGDRRKRLVFSTPRARELSARIMNYVMALEKEVFHGIPADEMRAFLGVVEKSNVRCLHLGATNCQR